MVLIPKAFHLKGNSILPWAGLKCFFCLFCFVFCLVFVFVFTSKDHYCKDISLRLKGFNSERLEDNNLEFWNNNPFNI